MEGTVRSRQLGRRCHSKKVAVLFMTGRPGRRRSPSAIWKKAGNRRRRRCAAGACGQPLVLLLPRATRWPWIWSMHLLALHASPNEHVLRVPGTGTTGRQERLTHRPHQSKLGFDGRERGYSCRQRWTWWCRGMPWWIIKGHCRGTVGRGARRSKAAVRGLDSVRLRGRPKAGAIIDRTSHKKSERGIHWRGGRRR
jgi:hypothetical protein